MITDLFRNTPTDAYQTAGAVSHPSQEVFYKRGPKGEHFYGAATQEMLNNVNLHYDSEVA